MLVSKEEVVYGLYHFPLAITGPFISWYFYNLSGGDFIGAGLIIAIPYFFLIFSTGIFGWISDFIGSKNLVLTSLGLLSVSFLCYYFIEDNAILLFYAYIGFNLITSAFLPSFNRLISFHSEEKRASKFGKLGMMGSGGFLLGSIFVSVIFVLYNQESTIVVFRSMFLIATVIAFSSFLLASRITETTPYEKTFSAEEQLSQSDSNLSPSDILSMNSVLILLIIISIINISSAIYVPLFTIFVEEELKGNISFISIGNSVATFLGILATYGIGTIANNYDKKYFTLIAIILYTLFPLGIFVFPDPLFIFLLYCLPFYAILYVIAPVYFSENSPESKRGQIMGYYGSSQYLGLTIGTLLGAVLASFIGFIRPNFLVASVIGIVGILICTFFFKESETKNLYTVP